MHSRPSTTILALASARTPDQGARTEPQPRWRLAHGHATVDRYRLRTRTWDKEDDEEDDYDEGDYDGSGPAPWAEADGDYELLGLTYIDQGPCGRVPRGWVAGSNGWQRR